MIDSVSSMFSGDYSKASTTEDTEDTEDTEAAARGLKRR